MKAFLAFILGLILGILVQRYVIPMRPVTASAVGTAPASEPGPRAEVLDRDKIREELERTGQVIREKARAAGAAVADATANARTTATIKTKFIREPSLSAFNINVDTTDGVVTLSGKVNSAEEVAKATSLALETEGVHKVVSTLQIKPR
jgi:hypothetical protein